LQPTIKFTSPEGSEFEAKWRKNSRSADKKLGIYFYPKVNGSVVDDLGINSTRMPITIYFDGRNSDVQARAFYNARLESGIWEVIHPVHGFFGLQMVAISEMTDPVDSGNITKIDVDWIEPIDPTTLETDRELAGVVDALSASMNAASIAQFVSNVTQATAALQNAIATTIQVTSSVNVAALNPITTLNDSIYVTHQATQATITDLLTQSPLLLEELAAEVQNLSQLPILATNDLQSRLDAYANVTDGVITALFGGLNQPISGTATALEKKNNAASVELDLLAALVAFAQIAITSQGIRTRVQAIEAAAALADNFALVQETLETIQEQLEDEAIDQQFFAQSSTFSDAALLTYKAIRYLQRLAFDLKVERRIILKKPRTPIEIAVTEYKGFGDADSNFELFLETNDLHGNDILLLLAGREVVIYD
jgi:prophage DNA circulation protein